MAAPSGTVWGSTVGDYGRIGIYLNFNTTNTTVGGYIEVWFWSKFSVSDSNNNLYADLLESSGSATTNRGSFNITTSGTNDAWLTSRQVLLYRSGYECMRTTSDIKRYFYAKLTGVDRVGGTMYASTTFTVPKLPSYTVSYNANGGSNAPSSQTKWYGKTLTLSNDVPTRAGYDFIGWALSKADADAGNKYYDPGKTCDRNENLTLYAVWRADTYTVSYNANGGSGAPGNQTKTHGVTLTLSSMIPTRTNYTFKGWATSASGGVAYYAGGSYTANVGATLYAVWELNYKKPKISNLVVNRCLQGGAASDDGTYMRVKFDWSCDRTISSIIVKWTDSSGTSGSSTFYPSGTSGSLNEVVGGSLNVESAYAIEIFVYDTGGYSPANTTLYGKKFVMDFLKGGNGIAFGKAAEREGWAEFGFDAVFNGNVQGNVLGLGTLPQILSNEDFNAYLTPGVYGVGQNTIAGTIANNPAGARAGRLIVTTATGGLYGVDNWTYLQQWYIPMTFTATDNAFYVRTITRSPNESPNYYSWLKFAGTNA